MTKKIKTLRNKSFRIPNEKKRKKIEALKLIVRRREIKNDRSLFDHGREQAIYRIPIQENQYKPKPNKRF